MSAVTTKPAIFGPVFRWELIRVSRRGLWHLCRFLFAATLLIYLYSKVGDRELRVTELSEFSAWLVRIYAVVQYFAVLIFTPLLTCGCILQERQQRTLPLLLASLLHPTEVVQGKLFGRLLGLLTVILTGIPILALLQFLGGIDFVWLLKETGVVLLLLLVLSINGMYQSSRARTLGGAVARTCIQTALHYLIAWVILLPPGLICFHLLGTSIYSFMATGGHFLACGFALIGLRRLTQNLPALALENSTSELQFMEKINAWTDVSHWLWRFKSSYGTPRDAWEYRFQTQYLHDVEQDGDVAIRHYRVPEVANHPLLWKDTWFPLDRNLLWLLTVGSMVLGCFTIGYYLVAVSSSVQSPTVLWLSRFFAYSVMLATGLLLALRATATLAEEHKNQTLDDLLVLPWSSRDLLWEKWCGVAWRYRFLLGVVFVIILPIHAMVRSITFPWLTFVFAAQVGVLISLCFLVTMLCRFRLILARLLILLVVSTTFTIIPWTLDNFWWRLPDVVMPANRSEMELSHRGVLVLERKDIVVFDSNRKAAGAVQHYWVHIANLVRNILCPLEAWHDLLTQQDYYLFQPSTASLREATRIGSPWNVHALTTIALVSISASLFGVTLHTFRRWRMT